MIDISMQYLGLELSGPIVVASTPLSDSIDNIRHMEDAGASAIVLTSLFEEQLALESRALDEDLERGANSFPRRCTFCPSRSTIACRTMGISSICTGPARRSRFLSWPA